MLVLDRDGTPLTVDEALRTAETMLKEAAYQERHDTRRADTLVVLADTYLRYAEIQAGRERFHITTALLRKACHPVENVMRGFLSSYARKK